MANILQSNRDRIKKQVLEEGEALKFVQRYIDYENPPADIRAVIYALEDLRELFFFKALIDMQEKQ